MGTARNTRETDALPLSGEHALDADAAANKPQDRAPQEARGRRAGWIGQDFDMRDAAEIIDREMYAYPAPSTVYRRSP